MAAADVGILLRRHRRAAGLSLEALAEASGVSVRAIGDMERGRARGPQARTMAALADALQLPAQPRAELLTAAREGRLRRQTDLPGLCDLPPDVPDFRGRVPELAELDRLGDPATRSALEVLSGAGGLGKSAPAVHAARRVAAGYPGGVLHVDLHGLDRAPMEPVEALGRLLAALGRREPPADLADRSALYRRLLAEREVLVVLDNARAEAQVRPLLAGEGRSTVLVTSRRLLTGLAHARRLALDPLPDDEAVALLADIAGVPRGDRDLRTVARLCGNYPLALRIAGNRLLTRPGWTVTDLAERLGRGRRLDQLVAGDLQVTAALALSYEQLDDDARRLFRRLSLAPGGSAGADIAAVIGGVEAREAEHQLDELVELSLLQPVAGGRVGLHDLVAEYAADRLAADETPEQRSASALALRSWLLTTACNAGRLFEPRPAAVVAAGDGLRFTDLAAAERWLVAEADNWIAALGAAAAAGEDATVVEVAESMHWFSDRRAGWRAWIDVFGWSGDAAERLGDDRLQAVHRNYQAWALIVHGLRSEAARLAERAGALARSAGDLREEAWAHRYAADAQSEARLGGSEAALAHYRRAGELFDQVGDVEGWLTALGGVGRELGSLGRVEEGRQAVERLLAGIEELRPTVPAHILEWQRSSALRALTWLLRLAGDLPGAEAVAREQLEVAQQLGVAAHVGFAWRELAAALQGQHRLADARAALLEARAAFVSGDLARRVADVDQALSELG